MWRPTPLYRAEALERELDTPAEIYFKYEGTSPSGSHKLNSALAQAYFARQEGIERLVTDTGAGQWGVALSLAGALMGIEVLVYMVRASFHDKPYRRHMMETFGAQVLPSPGPSTEAGRALLAARPDHPGSEATAVSDALEVVRSDPGARFSMGAFANHVLLHQTVIGLETREQLELADREPDYLIASVGCGSNMGGFALPWIADKLNGMDLTILAAEPSACATLTEGEYRYDFPDATGTGPSTLTYTLGHEFVPPPIHAGGLRYHGAAPLVGLLRHEGLLDARAYRQTEVFAAGSLFARLTGFVPAPEIGTRDPSRDRRREPVPRGAPQGHDRFLLQRPRAARPRSLRSLQLRKDGGHRVVRREGGDMRSYGLLIDGEEREGQGWNYTVKASALIADPAEAFGLKRSLELGTRAHEDAPDEVVGRCAWGGDREGAEALEAAARARAESTAERRSTCDGRWATSSPRRCWLAPKSLWTSSSPRDIPADSPNGRSAASSTRPARRRWTGASTRLRSETRHGDRRVVLSRKPDGVVCLNPPQNAAGSNAALGFYSLLAGNTLVVKAPRSTPLSVMFLYHEIVAPILERHGAPPGTLNLISGDTRRILRQWTTSPLVDDIMFFGDSAVGVKFGADCVAAGKKAVLELSGNDGIVVWRDADLEAAAAAMCECFYGSSQICMVPKYAIVHPEIADELLDLVLERVSRDPAGLSRGP